DRRARPRRAARGGIRAAPAPARSCPHPCRPPGSHRRRNAAGSASNPSLRFDNHEGDPQTQPAVPQVRRCETVAAPRARVRRSHHSWLLVAPPLERQAIPLGSDESAYDLAPAHPFQPAGQYGAATLPAARHRFHHPAAPSCPRDAGLRATREGALWCSRTLPHRAARTNPRHSKLRCGMRLGAGISFLRLRCPSLPPQVSARCALLQAKLIEKREGGLLRIGIPPYKTPSCGVEKTSRRI